MIVHTIDGVTWETVCAHMRSGSRTVKEGDYVIRDKQWSNGRNGAGQWPTLTF